VLWPNLLWAGSRGLPLLRPLDRSPHLCVKRPPSRPLSSWAVGSRARLNSPHRTPTDPPLGLVHLFYPVVPPLASIPLYPGRRFGRWLLASMWAWKDEFMGWSRRPRATIASWDSLYHSFHPRAGGEDRWAARNAPGCAPRAGRRRTASCRQVESGPARTWPRAKATRARGGGVCAACGGDWA